MVLSCLINKLSGFLLKVYQFMKKDILQFMKVVTPDWLVEMVMKFDTVDTILFTFFTGKIVVNIYDTFVFLREKGLY